MRAWLCVLCVGCNHSSLSSCGTQQLTVHLPAFAVDADQVQIGDAVHPHTPGAADEMYQVALDGDVTVSALRAGAVVTSAVVHAVKCRDASVDLTYAHDLIRVPVQTAKNRVDLLFMVDDSPSTIPKQTELKARFPQLIQLLDAFAAGGSPAWYHIGVVTSDLGAGPAMNGGCQVGGKGARLQRIGAAPSPGCQPPAGNFIDYNQLDGTNNLPPGQDLPTTFGCMASVGASGCGFEMQLEAAYKALHDCPPGDDGSYADCTIAENIGFLRNDSLLVVVLVTDEDDCSAPPDTDLFSAGKTTDYGPQSSFRCTRFGVECGGDLAPDDSSGPLADCHAAPNLDGMGPGKLFDVSRYSDYFQTVRGGDDLILVSLAAPPEPFSTLIGDPNVNPYAPCAEPTFSEACMPLLQHSCMASSSFFGDPAVRISQVVRSVKNWQETSICDPDYSSALSGVGGFIATKLGVACLPGSLADPTHPDCTVSEGGATLPACGQPPCWRVVSNVSCPTQCTPGAPPQQLAITVDRGSTQPPPGTVTQIDCTVLNRDLTMPPPACPWPL